jgi:hypothetical protein
MRRELSNTICARLYNMPSCKFRESGNYRPANQNVKPNCPEGINTENVAICRIFTKGAEYLDQLSDS